MRRSSSAVGAGVVASGSATRGSQPIVSRIYNYRVDDQVGDDSAVGVRADDRLVDQFLNHDDHALGGEGCLFLAAEQASHLGVAIGVRALRMDHCHVRLQGWQSVDSLVAVRRADRPDQRIRLGQVRFEVRAQWEEGQVRRAGRVPADHAEVAVFLQFQRSRIRGLDAAANGV
jgi:hypothetical protein